MCGNLSVGGWKQYAQFLQQDSPIKEKNGKMCFKPSIQSGNHKNMLSDLSSAEMIYHLPVEIFLTISVDCRPR